MHEIPSSPWNCAGQWWCAQKEGKVLVSIHGVSPAQAAGHAALVWRCWERADRGRSCTFGSTRCNLGLAKTLMGYLVLCSSRGPGTLCSAWLPLVSSTPEWKCP